MKRENLCDCPVCQNKLTVTSYQCGKCGTKIEGSFKLDKFASLSQDEKDFIELFVMKRGSIKEIERELGISYPTVRNKLDGVISALGHKIDRNTSRIEVLKLLDEGQITSEEATKMLDELIN